MNYRYSILATALAVGLFAIPATAGVTDVTGGSGVTVKTKVVDDITDVRKKVTKDVDVSRTNSKTKYEVRGVLNYHETSALSGNRDYDATFSGDGYNKVSDNLSSAKADVLDSLFDYEYNKQDHRFGMTQEQLNEVASWKSDKTMKRNDGIGNKWSVTQTRLSGEDYYERNNNRTVDEHTDYKENTSKETIKKTGSKLTYKGTDYSEGTILVGDPDSIFNAYTANGSVTINEVRTDYYTRTHVFEREHRTGTIVDEVRVEVYQLEANRRYSPIVLDLDGDGKIEASNGQYLAHKGFSNKIAAFDFFGNGFPVMTEWVGANDGLLCRPNADGSVKGTNLFGIANGFNNGYEEMASLDVDNSGALEGAELKDLRVWTDVNGNGIAEANELKTLDELGITSIKVSHNNYASTFVRNGKTYKSFDWWPNCREMRKVDMASVIK